MTKINDNSVNDDEFLLHYEHFIHEAICLMM